MAVHWPAEHFTVRPVRSTSRSFVANPTVLYQHTTTFENESVLFAGSFFAPTGRKKNLQKKESTMLPQVRITFA
jgi:hypothetical protein